MIPPIGPEWKSLVLVVRPYFITIINKITATTIAPHVPTSKKRNLKSFSIPRQHTS